MKIRLSNEQYELIKTIYNTDDLNEYAYDKELLFKMIGLDEDGYWIGSEKAHDLLDFIDDKKLEHGFEKNDEVNELGLNLTRLWDYVYNIISRE